MEMFKEAGDMFLEAAAGALLGPACESFLGSIEKHAMVDMSVHDRVESMVDNLELCIPKIKDHIMTLGDRQDKLKELEKEMIWARSLLNKLKEANELSFSSTSHYNNQLDASDKSLRILVRNLRLQLATLVLVSTKENTEVANGNKRKLDEVDERFESVFNRFKRQEVLLENLMNKIERNKRANQVGPLIEEGLGAALTELSTTAEEYEKTSRLKWWEDVIKVMRETREWTHKILGLEVIKTERVYMSATEVQKYRMSVENGVNLLRNCTKVVEWTDDLKAKYRDEFSDLEKTLDALYNRLAGIQRLQSNCRRCHESFGITSTLVQGSVGFCQ